MPKTAAAKKLTESQLKRKMAQSVTSSAPSMVPVPTAPKAQLDDEEAIEATLVMEADDADTLAQLTTQKLTIEVQLKPLENQKEGCVKRIKTILAAYGLSRVKCAGARLTSSDTTRSTINRTKLIAEGVPEDMIDRCTDTTTSTRLLVTDLLSGK